MTDAINELYTWFQHTNPDGTSPEIWALIGVVYFFPTLNAIFRRKLLQDIFYIFILNFLLGWSLIVWFICLFWAQGRTAKQVKEDKRRQQFVFNRDEEIKNLTLKQLKNQQ